jgi:hypothetical protein
MVVISRSPICRRGTEGSEGRMTKEEIIKEIEEKFQRFNEDVTIKFAQLGFDVRSEESREMYLNMRRKLAEEVVELFEKAEKVRLV